MSGNATLTIVESKNARKAPNEATSRTAPGAGVRRVLLAPGTGGVSSESVAGTGKVAVKN